MVAVLKAILDFGLKASKLFMRRRNRCIFLLTGKHSYDYQNKLHIHPRGAVE